MALSVLIVDDHAAFRRRARQLLEAEGFEVAGEAGTGAEGIRLAAELHPDVVLLDVHLPDGLGFEMVDGIEAPVILVSTHDESSYRTKAASRGARGFLVKDELDRATIGELLD